MIRIKKVWNWSGINKKGESIYGTVPFVDREALQLKLSQQGIRTTAMSSHYLLIFERFITADIITTLFREFATLLNVGIPLVKTLELLKKTVTHDSLRICLDTVQLAIQKGHALSDAFRQHRQYFDELYCNLIAIGEQTGNLAEIFQQIAQYQEKILRLKNKLKKALMYPVVVLCIALLVFVALLLLVIPQFQSLFAGSGAQLPKLTQDVISLSEWMQHYGIYFGLFWIAAGFIFWEAKKKIPSCSQFFDHCILHVPVFGQLLRQAILARFARILATTLQSGLPLLLALQACSQVVTNHKYRSAIMQVHSDILTGASLHRSLARFTLFPEVWVNMIVIGEESGTLAIMLTQLANVYEQKLDQDFDRLSELIEPVLIVSLSVLIGTLVIAMYLPIFKLGTVI